MELVIKLDDETYKQAINRTEFDTLSLGIKLIEAVQSGTPLPKGHGDLIDRKALLNRPYEKGGFVEWYDEIKHATSIIEADKGE